MEEEEEEDEKKKKEKLEVEVEEEKRDVERVKRFLASSIVAIPWTYEGAYFSPEVGEC